MKRSNNKLKTWQYDIGSLLEKSEKKLRKHKIKTAFLDSLLILGFVLNKSKEYILTHREKKLTERKPYRPRPYEPISDYEGR